jgi:hypothetical protein
MGRLIDRQAWSRRCIREIFFFFSLFLIVLGISRRSTRRPLLLSALYPKVVAIDLIASVRMRACEKKTKEEEEEEKQTIHKSALVSYFPR